MKQAPIPCWPTGHPETFPHFRGLRATGQGFTVNVEHPKRAHMGQTDHLGQPFGMVWHFYLA